VIVLRDAVGFKTAMSMCAVSHRQRINRAARLPPRCLTAHTAGVIGRSGCRSMVRHCALNAGTPPCRVAHEIQHLTGIRGACLPVFARIQPPGTSAGRSPPGRLSAPPGTNTGASTCPICKGHLSAIGTRSFHRSRRRCSGSGCCSFSQAAFTPWSPLWARRRLKWRERPAGCRPVGRSL
jgi:hypothetical protein